MNNENNQIKKFNPTYNLRPDGYYKVGITDELAEKIINNAKLSNRSISQELVFGYKRYLEFSPKHMKEEKPNETK